MPGLYRGGAGRPKLRGHRGLLIGVVDGSDRLVGTQIRPDDPGVRQDGKYRWLSSTDDTGGCGSGAPAGIAFPATWVPGTAMPRAIATEGCLKGYVVAQRLGQPVICFPGAAGTAEVPDLARALGARELVSAYDTDRQTNPHVAAGERLCHQQARDAGLAVSRLTWPTAAKGLDDALLAGMVPIIEPIIDDGAPACGERVRDLEAEVFTLRRDLGVAKRTIVTLVQTATNRNLGDSGGAAMVLIAADVTRQATVRPSEDGYYNVNPKKLADRWEGQDGEESRPAVLGQSTIRRYLKRFGEAGILDVSYRPNSVMVACPDRRTGGVTSKEVHFEEPWVRFAGSLPDQLRPATVFHNPTRPDRGGARPRRKVAVFPTACPDCGGPVIAACTHCGVMVEPVEIEVDDATGAALGAPAEAPKASCGLLEHSSNGPEERNKRTTVEGSCDQVERATAPPERNERTAVDWSCDQVERTTAPPASAGEPAPAAEAQRRVAAADQATDRASLHRATDDLAASLGPIAAARGRTAVPKPAASQDDQGGRVSRFVARADLAERTRGTPLVASGSVGPGMSYRPEHGGQLVLPGTPSTAPPIDRWSD